MKRFRIALSALVFLLGFSSLIWCEEPLKVSVCQLMADPPVNNHRLIEVEAFVSHDFEDFTLFDPSCRSWPAVWLEYGGTAKSDTIYCCGPTAGKIRPQELTVENIPIPLIENDQFKQFDREIQPPFRSGKFGSVVHADLIGRFFAGSREQFGKREPFWGGYGHMGCCSLLAVQEVKSVSPQDRDDLDYGASSDQPEIGKTGCGYSFLTPIEPGSSALQAQRQADRDPNSSVFEHPEAVASDFLKAQLKLVTTEPLILKQTRFTQGRIVYQWKQSGKSETYMVVVNRPSFLTFYSHDPKRVAWVVAAAYVSSCGSDKQVTRIR
jgi:hypothetical protein